MVTLAVVAVWGFYCLASTSVYITLAHTQTHTKLLLTRARARARAHTYAHERNTHITLMQYTHALTRACEHPGIFTLSFSNK